MTAQALYEHRPPAAVITINRPDKRNALSRALIAALTDAFEQAKHDRDARCVLLTGAGPAFCAGMDLTELSESIDAERAVIWEDALKLARLFELIYTLPKPTIAVVNGPAIAGGAGLVSVCDLAIAASTAVFGYPEIRRGLVAALIMPHLLRHVGERMARWLLLGGETIDALTAERCGLINEVVTPERLNFRAQELVSAIAQGGPDALSRTKELLQSFSRQAMSGEECAQASAAPRLTDECRHGLKAFFSKQPPPWMTTKPPKAE
jgi:methylglutaconyl-CoA hydratase